MVEVFRVGHVGAESVQLLPVGSANLKAGADPINDRNAGLPGLDPIAITLGRRRRGRRSGRPLAEDRKARNDLLLDYLCEINVLEHSRDIHDRGEGSYASRHIRPARVVDVADLALSVRVSGWDRRVLALPRVVRVDRVAAVPIRLTLAESVERDPAERVVDLCAGLDLMGLDQLQRPAVRHPDDRIAVHKHRPARQPLEIVPTHFTREVALVRIVREIHPPGIEMIVEVAAPGLGRVGEAILDNICHRPVDRLPDNRIVPIHVAGFFYRIVIVPLVA